MPEDKKCMCMPLYVQMSWLLSIWFSDIFTVNSVRIFRDLSILDSSTDLLSRTYMQYLSIQAHYTLLTFLASCHIYVSFVVSALAGAGMWDLVDKAAWRCLT
jgi:hypothetical protein